MANVKTQQLCMEWQILASEAIEALAEWKEKLAKWREAETVTDQEFMTAYANLTSVIGYWADDQDFSIDELREALTGTTVETFDDAPCLADDEGLIVYMWEAQNA